MQERTAYNKVKILITTGVMLMTIGITLLFKDYVGYKRDMVFSDMNLALSEISRSELEEEISSTEENTQVDSNTESSDITSTDNQVSNEVTNVDTNYEYYIAELEIPKINFRKGFYKKESSLNTLINNIKILPESSYPDQDKGNVIIAGHSGNYTNSYFANLYQLVVGDMAYIYYNNVKYSYRIVSIYDVLKTGTVNIYRDSNKSTMTLITCTKDDDEHQTIYILELVGRE